nr:putative ribonuclease H-like domain-containing protein [Tanacetum cinerariifolium]
MVAILEKYEQNINFHQIVDFVGASHIRARIAQSLALPLVSDEPASPMRDVSQGINLSGDDAPIKERRLDEEEVATERVSNDTEEIRLDEGEVAAERVSDDTKEMAKVLITMDAASVLSSGGVQVVPTATAVAPANVSISTGSGVVPNASTTISTATPIFATATTVTPYTMRKGKEKMVETHTPKKKKRVQEQIDIQFARELEEEDEEIAKIHAEEELQQMIEGLDRSNETIAKHMKEYKQAAAKLIIGERIELISELVKYQDHHSKILQYQAQQRKTRTKKQKRDFYMVVIRNNLGGVSKISEGEVAWLKRKGIRSKQESAKKQKTSEEVPEEVKSFDEVPEEKIKELIRLVPIKEVYVEALQVKHLIIDWKVHTEGQRSYWKITRLGASSASYQFFVDMLKQINREDLNHLWALVKETLSVKPATNEKEMELWVELKRLYEPDVEDHLWTHTQHIIHASVGWRLYDICGVHHVMFKDLEIFMLVEKNYPLRKALALVMICYKLQVENYYQMATDLVRKIQQIADTPSLQEFPLLEELPTAREDICHCQKKREATTRKIALLLMSRRNCQSKVAVTLRESLSICITLSFHTHQEIDQQYLTVAKIPILDTGKFEQWQFRIQQYLQHEHYAMWEVIEFGNSYEVPTSTTDTTTTYTTSGETSTKSGRTVTLTTEDMQKKKNDVKARTTLLLSLPEEHQLAKGSETLEKTFSRLQVIVGQLKFMDVEVEQDDLNQKFLTSLALEWLMHTIVWRNKSDLDTISLDDLYNHLKVYESEVQKKMEPNSQNKAFISLAKHNSGNKDGKKISIQGSDVAGFDKSKVKCSNCNKMGHFARECRAPRRQDRGRRDNFRQGSKAEEQAPKALMAIDGKLKTLKQEKDGVDGKLAGLLTASKDLDNLIESQRADKNKEGLGYSVVPPPPAQLYSSPKKDLSWTGLPEYKDDTVTYYTRHEPTVERSDSQSKSKTNETESPKKSPVKYAELYRKTNKKPNVRGNQRNWNNLKSHQLGNISYLFYYEPFDGGYVSFGQGGCKITRKGTIKTGKLEFENVYFMKDLKYNPFSVSQICDNKNNVLFTDSECIVLGRDFKLLDDANVLLRTTRQHNMYSIDLNNIVPHKDLTCLVAKAFTVEYMIWHRRLGHLNFKTMNKLVRHNLVRGLPTKCFENDHNCTASLKGKQHKASFVTDDFSRFTWTFFLKSKDETSGILKKFISKIENLKDLRVKIIRVLVNKSHNKTSYELFNGRTPAIGFIKPFGCHVMILNTLDNLGKLKAKGDEGYFIGYSMSSKAFRVFNKRTKRVKENLHIDFLENKAIDKGARPNWLFDIDSLTKSMNYVPVVDAGTDSTNFAGTKDAAGQEVKKDVSTLRYIALPNWTHDAFLESSSSKSQDHCNSDVPESSGISKPTTTSTIPTADQVEILTVESPIPTVSSPVSTACFTNSQEPSSETRLISKRVANQVETPSLDNKVWTLVDCPKWVRPIGTKWVLKNKKDERGIVIRNKARLVAQGHTQEEGIDYDEVFILVTRIEAIRLFLAYASFMGFTMYQMDVKSAFLYGIINEKVYLMQPSRFQDPEYPVRVYKVEKAMYGLHQAPRAWYGTLLKYLLINGFQRGTIDQTLFIRRQRGDFILVQVYVDDIIFGSSNPHLCREFEALMHENFQMSAMGELNFFLGLQVLQKEDGVFLSQDKTLDPKDSPFDLVAYSDSDYGGATQDCKSTTRGCQFLGRRLISWQCKKHAIIATLTTEAEYVAAASCCGQVLWIQN